MLRRLWMAWVISLLCLCAGSTHGLPIIDNDAIRTLLVERVDTRQENVGIVVGVLEPEGRRVVAYGRAGSGQQQRLDGDTVFEIGSLTEVFTAALLSAMVAKDEIEFDDAAIKYLPTQIPLPAGTRPIQLLHLAMHTSGVPRLMLLSPPPFPVPARRTLEQIFAPLAVFPAQPPGERYAPSNLGVGLLGLALANRAGTSYAVLLEQRICQPLALASTAVRPSPSMRARLATGHDAELHPVPAWNVEPLAAAEGLHSTANDLLKFLAAQIGGSELTPAMQALLQMRRPTGTPNLDIALGWLVSQQQERDFVWHSGESRGFHGYLGFDPQARVAVVVLSNTGSAQGVEDIGRHLLEPEAPLLPPRRLPPPTASDLKQITLPPKLLDRYTGVYVVRDRDRQKVAEGLRRDTLTFNADRAGRATELLYRERETEVLAKRVE